MPIYIALCRFVHPSLTHRILTLINAQIQTGMDWTNIPGAVQASNASVYDDSLNSEYGPSLCCVFDRSWP
jgi:hypothetical protein